MKSSVDNDGEFELDADKVNSNNACTSNFMASDCTSFSDEIDIYDTNETDKDKSKTCEQLHH